MATNSSTPVDASDIDVINLTLGTSLSGVVAATIQDVDDTSELDQYLGIPVGEQSPPLPSQAFTQHVNYQSPPLASASVYSSSCLYSTPTVTPVTKRRPQPLQSAFYSPAADNRFNDSLSGLLGSPIPASPLTTPLFSNLQYAIAKECKTSVGSMPESLLGTMTTQPQPDVFYREQLIQSRFIKLEHRHPEDVKQLSNFYRYQAAVVETERFRSLHTQPYSVDYQRSLNRYFDTQLHQFMERVEKSLALLEESACTNSQPSIITTVRPRPQLSKKAIRLMEEWYESHLDHPYPTTTVIDQLAAKGNINIEQVKKWFANKRNRNNNTRTLTEIARQKRRRAMQKVL